MTLTIPLCACGQPSPDAMLCRTCTQRLKSALQFAAAIAPDLDDAVARLLTRGSGGPRVRSHEVPLPIDLGASDVADELRNCLSGWIRCIVDTRPGAVWTWPADTVPAMALWLAGQLDVIRQHEAAADILDEVTAAVAKVLRVIDRQPERVGAGACELCSGPLWTEADSDTAVCGHCRAVVSGVRERRRAMAAEADVLGTPGEIAGALASLGVRVAPSTIRVWASRGRLAVRPGGAYAMSDVMALVAARDAR